MSTESSSQTAGMRKRTVITVWLIVVIALIANFVFPIRTGLTRVSLLALAFFTIAGAIALTWRIRILRFLIVGICVALSVFLLWPSTSSPDPNELRDLYIQRLQKYNGARYVYGGENRLGVDCSGLVREGMIEALISYGIEHHNPVAVRAAFRLWWHDSNAIMLGKMPEITRPVKGEDYVPLHNTSGIEAGDLALTQSGSHVLAYLGNNRWIEADPGLGRTHVFTLDDAFKNLSDELVLFVRWRWLESSR